MPTKRERVDRTSVCCTAVYLCAIPASHTMISIYDFRSNKTKNFTVFFLCSLSQNNIFRSDSSICITSISIRVVTDHSNRREIRRRTISILRAVRNRNSNNTMSNAWNYTQYIMPGTALDVCNNEQRVMPLIIVVITKCSVRALRTNAVRINN